MNKSTQTAEIDATRLDKDALRILKPTWPGKIVDLRKNPFKKVANYLGYPHRHIQWVTVASNNFSGCRRAWEFSNELLAEIAKAEPKSEQCIYCGKDSWTCEHFDPREEALNNL